MAADKRKHGIVSKIESHFIHASLEDREIKKKMTIQEESEKSEPKNRMILHQQQYEYKRTKNIDHVVKRDLANDKYPVQRRPHKRVQINSI